MSDPRTDAALARLERATARIERVAGAPPRPDPALEALRARHARLRTRVQEVVTRLDAAIAEGGG